MHDIPPPVPSAPAVTIEQAVREHLDVVHELREFREALIGFSKRLESLAGNHERLSNEATVDRLTLGRIERTLARVAERFGIAHG